MERVRNFLLICLVAVLTSGCAAFKALGTVRPVGSYKAVRKMQKPATVNTIHKLMEKLGEPAKDYKQYRSDLKKELDVLLKEKNAVLSSDAPLGIKSNYELHVETAVRLRLALAKLHLKQDKVAQAEAEAKKALAMIKRRKDISSCLTAELSERGYGLLRQGYEKQKQVFKAMIAGLSEKLLADYQASPAGIQDYYSRRQMMLDGEFTMSNMTEGLLLKIRLERLERAMKIIRVMSLVMQTVQTIDTSLASQGHGFLGSQSATVSDQFNRVATIMETVYAQQVAVVKDVKGDMPLNPAFNPMLAGQLFEKSMGVNPFEIWKDFSNEVRSQTDDQKAVSATHELDSALSNIAKARGQGQEQKVQGASVFVQAFTKLQTVLENLH